MATAPLPEIFSDVTLTIDPKAFPKTDRVAAVLSGCKVKVNTEINSFRGTFGEIEDVVRSLAPLVPHVQNGVSVRHGRQDHSSADDLQRGQNRTPEVKVEPVRVDPEIMAYVEKLHGKELDRIMGNEVSITEHKGHVTFQLLDQTKSAFHAQFAREKFITFYQKIATDLQKRTFQRDVTVLQHLRNPPLPLHILSDDPRTVTLMGSFLSLERFEEALKGTPSRPAQGVYPARRDSVKTSSVSVQKDQKPEKEQTCPICLDTLVKSETEILSKCKHAFCRGCLKTAFDIKPACPICGVLYGKLKGTQPEGGTMHVMRSPSSLPGYEGYGTITIYYDIPSGIQGEEHPNPGQTYTGTRRTAYLPDSKEGNKVLKLLAQAFDQRLVFTIGRSSTTGHNNAVTWNDIHHKTSQHGGPTYYGYPDPDYLQRVQEELKVKGIY